MGSRGVPPASTGRAMLCVPGEPVRTAPPPARPLRHTVMMATLLTKFANTRAPQEEAALSSIQDLPGWETPRAPALQRSLEGDAAGHLGNAERVTQ